jgi:hypothetical protein
MERPITRRLLASAIEYAARHKLDTIEWQRFFVNHYHDEMMEAARVKCVRLLNSCAVNEPVPAEIITELDAIAQALRQAP